MLRLSLGVLFALPHIPFVWLWLLLILLNCSSCCLLPLSLLLFLLVGVKSFGAGVVAAVGCDFSIVVGFPCLLCVKHFGGVFVGFF